VTRRPTVCSADKFPALPPNDRESMFMLHWSESGCRTRDYSLVDASGRLPTVMALSAQGRALTGEWWDEDDGFD
jgi:hypothetical protein